MPLSEDLQVVPTTRC